MEGINDILSRIKDFATAHAVDVENELLSYDYKKKGVISTVSLHRWFSSIGINLSNRAIQTIILNYQTEGGVNVRNLINDIKNSNSYNATLSARPPTCTAELTDLARELARRRQNIRDALHPFDRMNSGHVSVNNFYRCFGSSPTTKAIVDFYLQEDYIDYLRIGNDLKSVSKTFDNSQYILPEQTPAFVKLATFIKFRAIDAKLIFAQNDRLNTGKMPRRQFYAVLSSFGDMISPSGLTEIANSFAEGDDQCNYNLFCQALDKFVPPAPRAVQKVHEIPEELSKAADPQNLLEAARGTISTRRIDVDAHFTPCEREYPGQDEISLSFFDRLVYGMRIDLTHEEIESIAALFKGPNGGVLYKDFCNAVRIPVVSHEINTTDILTKLKDYLSQSHQLLYPSAARFDREGSGNIAVQQLISALQFVRFNASNQEIAALRDAYPGTQRNTISWQKLCADCDSKDAQYNNSQQQYEALGTHSINAQKEKLEQYNLPPKNVSNILLKVANAANQNHIDIFSQLSSQDHNKRGSIPQYQFTNFVYSLPTQFTPIEIRTIGAFYRVSGSSDVNYVAFTTDIKKVFENHEEEQKLEETSPKDLPPQDQPLPEIPQNLHAFIRRYKSFAQQMRISTIDIFRPYDTNHNGTVPVYTVQACFNNFNFQSSRNEIEQLVQVFRDKRKTELFDYNLFMRAVDEEDISSPDVLATLSSAPMSSQIERVAEIACSQIREKLLARHRRIEIAFSDVQSNSVSTTEFTQRLSKFDIVLTAGQLQSLVRKYRINLTDQIDYKTFISDVNNSKTI